jgi:hypothetical protein
MDELKNPDPEAEQKPQMNNFQLQEGEEVSLGIPENPLPVVPQQETRSEGDVVRLRSLSSQ